MFRRPLTILLPVAALAILAVIGWSGRDTLASLAAAPAVGAGLAAELGCAGVFVMGRTLEDVQARDITPSNPLLANVRLSVDPIGHSVTATAFHLVSRTAIARPGVGCTLINRISEDALRAQAADIAPMAMLPRPGPWPAGDATDPAPPPGTNTAALQAALDAAFSEDAPAGALDTRAILVAYRGQIVAERYAPGFTRQTRLLGWSMSKSVTSALIGMLVSDGKLALDAPPPVPAWRAPQDPRAAITLRQMLQMRSGLAFTEAYGPGDDSTEMLFGQDDMGLYAATRPLAHPPGQVWAYSSGTTNILAHLVFDASGGTLAASTAFMRQRLFLPAGMTSAVFQPDGSGAFTGSSYLYMTARDWARFGELYRLDGQINGQRLLPADWITFSRTSGGTTDTGGGYGGQFWLNADAPPQSPPRWPHLPRDTYAAMGHNDQIVAIIPSRETVIVRLGWSTGGARFDMNRHFAALLAALPPAGP